jgi:CO/xanthine dehydrogenase FAD-binding subunit
MIDISGLGIDTINVTDNEVVIGGATPLQSLVEDQALERAFGGLVNAAARRLAHYGLRNLATIGGAMTSPSGPPELALALLALGSQAVFVGTEEMIVPLTALWSGGEESGRGLLKELHVPRSSAAHKGWGLEWLARSPMDQALVAACAAVEVKDGMIVSPRLAVASVGMTPRLVSQADARLTGASVSGWTSDELVQSVGEAVAPEYDFRASAKYQKDMMARLAGRAMAAALKKAGA